MFARKDFILFILTQPSSLSSIILFNIQSFQIEKEHSGQIMQGLNFNLHKYQVWISTSVQLSNFQCICNVQTKRNPKAYFNYRFELLNAVKPHPEQFLTLHPQIYQEACQVVRNLSHSFSKNELAKRRERERERKRGQWPWSRKIRYWAWRNACLERSRDNDIP